MERAREDPPFLKLVRNSEEARRMLRSFWDVKWKLQLNGVTTRGAEWNILVNIRRLILALPYVGDVKLLV